MMAEPALAAQVGARFDHVLVDEYQDTNRLQAAILLALKPTAAGVTVVGDDAQSIYSFRGADGAQHPRLSARSSRQPARIVTLERNYRSTQPILDASNAVIAQARRAPCQDLWTDKPSAGRPQLVLVPDEAQQARWVADQVLAQREGGLRAEVAGGAVSHLHHSAALELELARRNIPFVKFGGLKFLEAAHVKDLLAVLRFAQNPRGRMAGFRVAQLMPGIGPATATRLLDAMARGGRPGGGAAGLRAAGQRAATTGRASSRCYAAAARRRRSRWPADMDLGAGLVPAAPGAPARRRGACARGDLEQLARLAAGYAIARALPDRAHARPARGHQRPAPARRCSTRTT